MNRHARKHVRFLKYHADAPADVDGINPGSVKILAIEQHFAFDAATGCDFVHSIKAPDKSRLAAARWSDQSRYLVRSYRKIDVLDGLEVSVINIQLLYFEP